MEHYSSVRTKDDPGDGPAHMFHRSKLLQKPQDSKTSDKKKEKKAVNSDIPSDIPMDLKEEEKTKSEENQDRFSEKVEHIKMTTGFQVYFLKICFKLPLNCFCFFPSLDRL